MPLNKFTVKVSPGSIEVTVDGVDLAPTSLALSTDGQIPVLDLQFPADVDLSGVGIARVVTAPTPSEVLEVAADWLEGLDPEAVRAVVAGRMQTMRDDPVTHTIRVIAESAREATDG